MNQESEKKICQNCKQDFIIEPDDFAFYEKMKVPTPTFCPECRYIRRLLDRNEYNFYKRKCDATGENIISIYRPEAPFPVYKQEYWKSDAFDATSYGRDFDFSKSFFEQYEELRRAVPHLALVNSNSPNSEYTNQSEDNKDCYMLVTSGSNEKCMYGSWNQSKCFFCSDCYMIEQCEFCYESINLTKCSQCAFAYDCADCVNVYFSKNCRGCINCFGCVGLRNKQYCWFNQQLSKEDYSEKVKQFGWTRERIKSAQKDLAELQNNLPVKYYHGSKIQNSTGDYLENTQRARVAFNCRENKDTSYMQDAWNQTEDCRDCTEIIIGELAYEIQGVETPHRTIVARSCFGSIIDSAYCDMCFGVRNCFGCFGLKQKEYCILNKQYTKSDYLELKEKIISYTRKTGEWGEYFPSNVSPFSYNESMAQDYFPLTKEEALKKGYSWYDKPETNYSITLTSDKLPATINDTQDEIVKEIIKCKTQENDKEKNDNPLCVGAFKLTPLELMLYRKLNIPVPEYCFPCRRTKRFMLRNPRRLWHRHCMKEGCTNEFETSYAPDRPEIVYCEQCYNAEVA
ncbi:MAG: hypothetical protein WC711_03470 [Candidatus Staskawiczbacteria bacterium]|jgi:hypothetical protein